MSLAGTDVVTGSGIIESCKKMGPMGVVSHISLGSE